MHGAEVEGQSFTNNLRATEEIFNIDKVGCFSMVYKNFKLKSTITA